MQGPTVTLSFLLAAIVAGLVAFTYARNVAALCHLQVQPILGSMYYLVNFWMEFAGWASIG